MDDTYGLFASRFATKHDLAGIEAKLNELYQKPASTRNTRQIARLMQARDAILAKAAAKKGAMLAAASIPGLAGGLASSGIRGMDVVEHEFTPQVMRDYNVDGAAQGLRQQSIAPPGSGRLVNINFVAPTVSTINPVVSLTAGAGAIGAANVNLQTNAVNWAVLRIVALVTQQSVVTAQSIAVMQDFRIGGSPNLFLPEDWVLASDYDTDNEKYAGLRAYPILISPNNALMVANAWGDGGAHVVLFTASLVTEVLRDDAFGPGLPGAYAR